MSRAARAVRIAALVLVLVLAVAFFASRWDEVRPVLARLSAATLIGSLLAGCAAIGCAVPAWRALLAQVDPDHELPWRAAARVFLLGQLGKFVPGAVWVVVAQTELGRRYDVPRRATATAGLLSMGVSLATALGVAAVFVPLASADLRRDYWWLALLGVAALAGLAPPVLTPVVRLGLRLLRREPLARPLSWAGMGRSAAWSVLGWLFYGLHTWLLLRGLGAGGDGSLLARGVGGFAFAFAVGFVVVIAPAGGGVREAVLIAVFGSVLAGGGPAALALVSRVLLTVADLLGGGAAALLSRRSSPSPPVGESHVSLSSHAVLQPEAGRADR